MGIATKTHTFVAGAIIVASEHNTNFDTIYNAFNGNIDNANIAGGAGIVDTKLAQITTANKVGGDALNSILEAVYPVGAIYINITGVNPGTELGIGTWTAFGDGRVPVGYDAGDTDFDTAEEEGGVKEHQLTIAELATHGHPYRHSHNPAGAANNDGGIMTDSGGTPQSHAAWTGAVSDTDGRAIGGTGDGDPHTNVQPYIVVHMFKRTV